MMKVKLCVGIIWMYTFIGVGTTFCCNVLFEAPMVTLASYLSRFTTSLMAPISRSLLTAMKSFPERAPIVIEAVNDDATRGTMVFFHGVGDSGYGWETMCRRDLRFRHLNCVLPHAPVIPYTFFGNRPTPAWFNRLNLSFNGPEDVESLEAGITRAHALFDRIIADGTPSEKLVVAGFSQGGALALTSGLTYPSKLAGIIGIGCFVMRKETLASRITANSNTPVLLIHGNDDEIVPIEYATKTFDFLKQLGINVKMHTSPESGHELPTDAIGLFRQSVEEWVPQD